MIELDQYFVRIKLKEKTITEGAQILPYSTPTISKLRFFPKKDLEDLSQWSGYENTGYISVLSEKIDEYYLEEGIFESSKKFLCEEISRSLEEPIGFGVAFKGTTVIIDKDMKASLAIKSVTALRNKDFKFNLKCNTTFLEFTSDEILELCDIICEKSEEFMKDIKESCDKLNSIENFADLRELSL